MPKLRRPDSCRPPGTCSPPPRGIKRAPKLLHAPGGIENRHQDKDSRKIDRAVNVESQDCIRYFGRRTVDQEVTGHCRYHCTDNNFNQEIEPRFTHGCDRCTAQSQGHREPYKGKNDFGKKRYLNSLCLQMAGKIEIFSGKQRQAQQNLNQRKGKAPLTTVQANAQKP